ncbi:hypothetical protein DFH28DRAFT_892860 [Melampsora americana]|nr:hypothetical protein DFH28DRAFT_911796 [Melampsora americana]KAH9815646.1 hypothetical protein DFH28DRAFT_892860 [Melampsora americana]
MPNAVSASEDQTDEVDEVECIEQDAGLASGALVTPLATGVNVTPATHRHPFPRLTNSKSKSSTNQATTSRSVQPTLQPGQHTDVEGDQDSSPTKRKSDPKTTTTRMRWGDPGPLDVLALSHLISFEPFGGAKKEVVERFLKCSQHLKVCLKTRYDNLKVWLKRAEALSAGASGTQEDDGELRDLIATLIHEEEVSVLLC